MGVGNDCFHINQMVESETVAQGVGHGLLVYKME